MAHRYLPEPSKDERREALMLAGYQCQKCHALAPIDHPLWCGLDVNHVTGRAEGGTNEPENLSVLCIDCHQLWHLAKRVGVLYSAWLKISGIDRSGQFARHIPRGQGVEIPDRIPICSACGSDARRKRCRFREEDRCPRQADVKAYDLRRLEERE